MDQIYIEFRSPEATAREIDFLLSVHRDILLYDLMRHLCRGHSGRAAAAETDKQSECADAAQYLDFHIVFLSIRKALSTPRSRSPEADATRLASPPSA